MEMWQWEGLRASQGGRHEWKPRAVAWIEVKCGDAGDDPGELGRLLRPKQKGRGTRRFLLLWSASWCQVTASSPSWSSFHLHRQSCSICCR